MLYLDKIIIKSKKNIKNCQDISQIKNLKIKLFGKKSELNKYMKNFKYFSKEKKIILGKKFNKSIKIIKKKLKKRQNFLEKKLLKLEINKKIDISLPGRSKLFHGNLHPITQTINCIEDFFNKFGFISINGSEIEDSYHNFDALNILSDHPARNINDTFWFDKNRLLRTQTSSIQIHILKNKNIPIRIISYGKVYRKDYDKNHTPMFHQIEGLNVDKNINIIDLKNILKSFLDYFFEKKVKLRFRSSYFPFTEPSLEIDILNKQNKWIEILGCGMVHPDILYNAKINTNKYSGFAFGIGIERLTMLRYGISDLRIFFENDLRFLKQF
ncbi:phenylalanine--tRNA ligase subunit alpha [Sodalis-like secondary symbiont of Drepanosiphum platanoidis]|uniref:phenylalanine--tRNA ligase subunit alpha n=1 Tax=Sodalis-like secondary symbiont of Drepanosiphum platanoidis TaxID=2994493 RepID=UPI003463A14D